MLSQHYLTMQKLVTTLSDISTFSTTFFSFPFLYLSKYVISLKKPTINYIYIYNNYGSKYVQEINPKF